MIIFSYETSKKFLTQAENKNISLVSQKIYKRKNYKKENNKWNSNKEQTHFEFIIESINEKDKNKKSYYSVTFILDDVSKGIDSLFEYRVGNQNEYNPLNKNQENFHAGFFFNNENRAAEFNILAGVNRTNKEPTKRNPNGYLFFDKASAWIVNNVLVPYLSKK